LFTTPGSPTEVLVMLGAITTGSGNGTVAATQGLIPGLPLIPVPGIPGGTYVGAITSATVFTMVDINNVSVTATLDDAEASLTFEPLPLDLTGIEFIANVRSAAGSNENYLTLQTADGSFVNGNAVGTLGFNILKATWDNIPVGSYVIDIVAIADGHTINMFPEGPATLVLSQGVTLPVFI
jgi:hypothetical protein